MKNQGRKIVLVHLDDNDFIDFVVEILEIGRPNPNPKNIHGVAIVNSYRVAFNFQEKENGALNINDIIIGYDWRGRLVVPYHKLNHQDYQYYGRAIVNYLYAYPINY